MPAYRCTCSCGLISLGKAIAFETAVSVSEGDGTDLAGGGERSVELMQSITQS